MPSLAQQEQVQSGIVRFACHAFDAKPQVQSLQQEPITTTAVYICYIYTIYALCICVYTLCVYTTYTHTQTGSQQGASKA